jgi:proteasome lid subunit RPN8/RPN11
LSESPPVGPELRLPSAALEEIIRWSRAAHPREACGFLIGHPRGAGWDHPTVRCVRRAGNVAEREALDRFEADPGELVAAERAARDEGWELVGFWHSHPEAPAQLSARDRAGAWEGFSLLVVSVPQPGDEGTDRRVEARSFRRDASTVAEESFVEEKLRLS